MRTRALKFINTGGELVERELKGWYAGLRHEWAEMCKEGGSMWEDLRSKWQRKRSEVLRVALLALFVVAMKIVTGVGPIATCFLAVMLMLPCAFVVLVFGAGCVHVWTLVRWAPSTAHIEAPVGACGWECLAGEYYGRSYLCWRKGKRAQTV